MLNAENLKMAVSIDSPDDAKTESAHRLSFARLSAATTVVLNIVKWGALVACTN